MTRILIIKPSSLGDIIHGLMAAQSIRAQMPDCSITWVAREIFAPLVQGCPTVDRTIVFQRHGWWGSLRRFFSELRREPYDYVLDFQGLARSGLMTLLARGRVKIGRSDARECAGWAYSKTVPLPAPPRRPHAVEVLLEFLPLMGLEARLDGPIRLAAQPLPAPHDRLAAARPIVLLPHSRRHRKEWPGFVDLTRLLLERMEGVDVIWSSQKRMDLPEDLAANPRFHNLAELTTLPQMVGLVQAARVVVANDSGPMHIAAAVGTPLVACFGPTSPELFGPYPLDQPTHRVLRAPDGNLRNLAAASVCSAVEDLLRSTAGPGPTSSACCRRPACQS